MFRHSCPFTHVENIRYVRGIETYNFLINFKTIWHKGSEYSLTMAGEVCPPQEHKKYDDYHYLTT